MNQAFDIAQARRLAAHALSRAHMTPDFRQKELWQGIAEEWLTRAETLEKRLPSTRPRVRPQPVPAQTRYNLVRNSTKAFRRQAPHHLIEIRREAAE
jgi:hypothetical protein